MTQQALIGEASAAEPGTRVSVRALVAGQEVRGVFGVRERDLRQKKNGESWLRLVLCDSSGSVEAVSWDEAEARYALAEPGEAIHVKGIFETSERWGSKVKLAEIRRAEPQEYDAAELASSSDVPLDRLEQDLRQLLATIQDPQLRAAARTLLRRALGDAGRGSGRRRRRRSTTRPTGTGCSSTRSPSRRRSAPPPPTSRASTATWR